MLVKSKTIQSLVVACCLFVVGAASIHADEHAGKGAENKTNAMTAYPGWGEMTPAMKKSMDPKVMNNMMNMMMTSPDKLMTMESCAQCHTGEEIARYQKDFGPMMEAMKPMMSMMNPMMNMMYPMMAPMVNPMMGMMYPTMGMMGPMMNPMMGMMSPMMHPMKGMNAGMMGPTMGMINPMMAPAMGMMDPKQYEKWFNQQKQETK